MKKAVLAALLLCSCLDNSLGGSVSEVFPIDISGTELRRNEQAIQVTYFRNRGVFLDVVARVSVSLEVDGVAEDGGIKYLVPARGTTIVVTGDYEEGHPRCVVTHAPGGEPVRNLPPIKRGDFVITAGGGVGEETSGNFSLLFEAEGGDLGFGRTLYGSFKGEMLDAGFGELQ